MSNLRELLRRQEVYGGRRKSATRTLNLSASPSNEIVTTSLAKTWLRVTSSTDDTLIGSLIKTARASAEAWLDRAFLTQTWEYWLDEHDPLLLDDVIELPRAVLQSITSIASFDDANSATTFSSASYYTDVASKPGRVALVSGKSWPTGLRNYASIRIIYKAGWGDAISNVETQYREWIVSGVMETVAALYEHRGDDIVPGVGLTQRSMEILQPIKIIHI